MNDIEPSTTPDRIVILNDASIAKGGATGLALLSARLLRAAGHDVTYICGDAGQATELADLGAEVVALGSARLLEQSRLRSARMGLWNGAARAMIGNWIARHDTPRTVYHMHGWAQILSPSAFSALAPVSRRTVLHAHDAFLACPNGVYMDFQRNTVCTRIPLSGDCLTTHCDKRSRAQKGWRVARHELMRRALLRCDWGAVAIIHPAMAEPLARGGLDAQRMVLLRNPVNPPAGERIRAEENRSIAFVGRLVPDKGVADLARACAALDLPVTFIGDGPEGETLTRLHPGARVTGWLDEPRMAAELIHARALAMPSRVPEPFGLAAAEGSLRGLPIILPDIALLSDDIRTAKLGLVYSIAGPDGLRQALEALMKMSGREIAQMSENGYRGVGQIALRPDAWINGMLGIYAGLIDDRSG